ncbi:uncharacterized protein LOC130939326 [Arachis stenosperma]|uniref:uncharacterized protein LOC130939326 n=1 Tax=Arachis stenosperma TaxID=217475 RepID=UPI0025ACD004|nr:uncharacterized protein LOC130939326 [Arachis stenosperma]
MSIGREDNVVWKFDSKGIFSTNSFMKILQSETLVNTKDRLSRLGVIVHSDNICVLCKKEVESVQYLFLLCEAWQVWCSWLISVGQVWETSGTIRELFERWLGIHRRKHERKLWLAGFFAVIWNIWLERNARIFKNEKSGVEILQRRTILSYTNWTGSDPGGGY